MDNEVTVYVAQNHEGWYIKFGFDDGQELWSERPYPTRAEAEAAITQWCKDNGARAVTAQ